MGLGLGLRFCISNQLPGESLLMVHGSHFKQQGFESTVPLGTKREDRSVCHLGGSADPGQVSLTLAGLLMCP